MPRIENAGPSVDAWHASFAAQGNGSSTFDVCRRCWQRLQTDPTFRQAEQATRLKPFGPREPVGEALEEGCFHPPYEEHDQRCACCARPLRDRIDG